MTGGDKARGRGATRDKKREMVRLTRTIVCSIWERARRGGPLDPGEERVAEILRAHPEYESAWEIGAVLVEPEYQVGGVNPFLHAHLHLVVENQVRTGAPPEARRAVEELARRMGDRHEALHAVAAILIDEMRLMMQNGRPLDPVRYAGRLKDLREAER